MVTPILSTKLYIPPLRPNLVSRPRLIERLNKGLRLGHRLTLISAPAGFGKTTLLSEWVTSCGRPVAWLSLDESDNDSARFLAYLIAALQKVEENIGAGALSALQSPQPPPMRELLAALINQINAIPDDPSTALRQDSGQGSGRNFVLVLDDYHLVTAQPIHDALTFLLDYLQLICTWSSPAAPTRLYPSRALGAVDN